MWWVLEDKSPIILWNMGRCRLSCHMLWSLLGGLTVGRLHFQNTFYFACVVFFVEISCIQICGWMHEVSDLSACDIVSAQLACDHIILASSGQFGI